MEYTRLGRSGLVVSRICLGAMNFGTPEWGCDRDVAAEIVATFRDAGGDFFDTADVYGDGASEEMVGELLRGCRNDVVIATKVGLPTSASGIGGGHSARHLRRAIEASLRRLGTEYVDLYQLHHFDRAVPLEETLGVLDDLVREGKVRYAGCSNYLAWQIAEAQSIAALRGYRGLASVQMMYNLIRRDIEREHVEYVRRSGVGLIAYGALHAGLLASGWTSRDEVPPNSRVAMIPEVYLNDESRAFAITATVVRLADEAGVTPGQLALAWALRNDAVSAVLTAADNASQLAEHLLATELDVPSAVMSELDALSALPPSYPTDFYQRLHARLG
jgi:aryl-alcohol dehydrogenase-like predicted oxidoreductase